MTSIYLKEDEFKEVFKKHIKSSEYSIAIKTLFGERMTRKVDYHPYYQRNYVWDIAKASFFIESILLGTDVPPLIFFNSGSKIEVIDGRQRYETIKRFRNGDFKLNYSGLNKLTQLKNYTFLKLDDEIKEIFENAKIRIFEYEVFNEPRMEVALEDKIKKEIFRRYNSGITPLVTSEINNAAYDDDEITNKLKSLLLMDESFVLSLQEHFIGKTDKVNSLSPMLHFLRRYLVLSSFPINTYATGVNRQETIDLLYGVISNNTEAPDELCQSLLFNIKVTIEIINKLNIKDNKLINYTLLWAIYILVNENADISILNEDRTINYINDYFKDKNELFSAEKSHHYISIVKRHKTVAAMFEYIFKFDFSLYFKKESFKNEIKDLRQSGKETKLKLDELASLRVQKPQPSVIPIEQIVVELSSNKYLVRPSYQRLERINIKKASAIIESIILGINLPPIFIYINEDGVSEVIDGQQRILSILGFLGKHYLDESGKVNYPKSYKFKLKDLKILTKLNGLSYEELEFLIQDKILESKLSVIEIEHRLNANFEPVDLFIRLNNKPYPIKENSFEMWNSFTDKDVIQEIKNITNESVDWFFLRQRNSQKTSDRMLNEELITLLSYIRYNSCHRKEYVSIGYYVRDGKVTCRITDKKDVSSILEKITTDYNLKTDFLECIKYVCEVIGILKSKLDNGDLKGELNNLLGKESNRRYLVDFYVLFQIIQSIDMRRLKNITFNELKIKMEEIKNEINNPNSDIKNKEYQRYFEGFLIDVSNK